jgi:hypothetical protein
MTFMEWMQSFSFQMFEIDVLEQGCAALETIVNG